MQSCQLYRTMLTAKPAKCTLGKRYVEYLGHVGDGIVTVPEQRVLAMREFKQPLTRRDVRVFLGAISYLWGIL